MDRLLGKPLHATKQLRERKEIVLKNRPHSMEELWDLQSQDNTSLGLVKPKEVVDFTAEPDSEEWKPRWQEEIAQLHLFGPERKPLNKVPFKFRYKFRCFDERCKGHSMMIEDWEVGQLYWNQLQRCGSPSDAVRSVRMKFLDEICSPKRDPYFFVGTVLKYTSWIILGIFWPPRTEEEPAFDF